MLFLSTYFIPITVHPFFYATIALIIGIYTSAYFSCYCIALCIILAIIVGIAVYRINKYIPKILLLLFASFTIGIVRYSYQHYSHQKLFCLTGQNSFDMICTISNITRSENQRMRYCIIVTVEKIKIQEPLAPWHYINKRIQIYTNKKPYILVCDQIYLKNANIKKPTNESFHSYLIKEDINATLFITEWQYQLMFRPVYSISRWLYYFKNRILDTCKEKLSDQTYCLFASIFFGNRTFGKKEMQETKYFCKTWGISHYLARSGLHLVIFVFVLQAFLQLLPISLVFKELSLILLSVLYFILSWSSISFIRAFLTFILYKMCILVKVPAHFLYLLTLVTFYVLVDNPMQIFFLDFQLSFGLTFSLLWFNHVHNQRKYS